MDKSELKLVQKDGDVKSVVEHAIKNAQRFKQS